MRCRVYRAMHIVPDRSWITVYKTKLKRLEVFMGMVVVHRRLSDGPCDATLGLSSAVSIGPLDFLQ